MFLLHVNVNGDPSRSGENQSTRESDTFMPPSPFYFFSRPDVYCQSQKQLYIAFTEKVNALATELIDFISGWALVKNQSIKT